MQQTVNRKLEVVLNQAENVKVTAQYIINIFDSRSKIESNLPVTSATALFHLLPEDQCPACMFLNNQQ